MLPDMRRPGLKYNFEIHCQGKVYSYQLCIANHHFYYIKSFTNVLIPSVRLGDLCASLATATANLRN